MFDTTALSEFKCLFDTVIMKEFILCRKGFDLVQSCKHVAICLCFLQMQIFIFSIHNKAVYIDKIVVTLARIFTFVSKQITAVSIPCIKAGLFLYFAKNSLA